MPINFSLVSYDYTKGQKPSGTVFYDSKQGYDLSITGLKYSPVDSTREPGRVLDPQSLIAISKEYDAIQKACSFHIKDARNSGLKVNRLEGELVNDTVVIKFRDSIQMNPEVESKS